jgi:tetratricopeptide (TPR) repeat protein
VLRSNCQGEDGAAIAAGSRDLLDRYDRDILIEGMYAADECGDLATTEKLFKCLRTHFKVDPVALEAAVRLNLMLGKADSAADCFQTWADVDQQSAEFFFAYSQLCLSAKDFAEAETALTSATELQPFSGQYHAALANLLFKVGQEEKALAIAKYAVKIDPDSIHPWFALANVSHNPAEASEALAKATELRKTVIDLAHLSLVLTPANV